MLTEATNDRSTPQWNIGTPAAQVRLTSRQDSTGTLPTSLDVVFPIVLTGDRHQLAMLTHAITEASAAGLSFPTEFLRFLSTSECRCES